MSILYRISLAQKFAVLGLIALLMTALPSGLYVSRSWSEVQGVSRELDATGTVIALHNVVQWAQRHRDVAAVMLVEGDAAASSKRSAVLEEMARALAQVDRALNGTAVAAPTAANWAKSKADWAALEQAVANRKVLPAQSLRQHTELVVDWYKLNAQLLDDLGLAFDSEPVTNGLIQTSLVNAPMLVERLNQMRAVASDALNQGSLAPANRAKLAGLHEQASDQYSNITRSLAKATRSDPGVQAALGGKAQELQAQIDQTLSMLMLEIIKAQDLTLAAKDFDERMAEANRVLQDFNELAQQTLLSNLSMRLSDTKMGSYLVFGALMLVTAGAFFLALAFVRSITAPLQEAVDVARAVADGNLAVSTTVRGSNEIAQLMEALSAMRDKLSGVVAHVRQNADSVSTASAEIALGNNELSARTELQASTLEQTAASMEELSAAVEHNAENARKANQLALDATTVATKGGDVMGRFVETMKGINDGSKKIAEIISVIDGIAFQTNILALNAAVESARAGDHGRGFAVVASEVRSLAQRSAEAAKEIKTLITSSVERVEHGTLLVDEVGGTMQEVVESIKRVSAIMGEISLANTEQSAGVSQMEEAVTQMDQTTQQNAALVEQSAAAADHLKRQAQQLVEAVSVFKL